MAFLAGEAFIPVLPNATGFSALLAKQVNPAIGKMETGIKGAVQRITGNVTGLGTSIGTSFGLGLAVAGVAAGKMALDFENAFTKIAALSNSSADDINRWKGEVLDLAGTTARAPQELADALFFLSSAGLESGQVMEALNVSAKAAAVGLGTTVDVANIVASSLNAYADSGLRAADVTDTLVAAVRAGRAEPEAFANSLGKLLPIAVQAGVSFQDLTASLASLSNVGLDVDEAATAMRGALQAIAAPGSQAAEAMDQLGLSAQDLLDAISQRGLFGAFQLLDQAARDSTSSQAEYIGVLRKVIPNVRALTGILGLTGQEAAKVDAVFQQTANSTGDLNTAFQIWVKGPGASFAKLMTEMKVAAIKFGEAILPMARTLANILVPVLKVAADNAGLLLTAFLAYKTVTFVPTLLLAIATTLDVMGLAMASSAVAGVGLTATLAGIAAAAGPVAVVLVAATLAGQKLNDVFFKSTVSTGQALASIQTKLAAAFGAGTISMEELRAKVAEYNATIGQLPGAEKLTVDAIAKLTGAAGPASDAVDTLAASHEKAAQGAIDQLNAELALAGNLTGILGSLQSAATASDDLAAARRHLDQLTNRGKQGSKEYRKAVDDVAAAELSALDAQLNIAGAVESYAAAVRGVPGAQKAAIEQIKTFGAEAGLTKGQIDDMLGTLRDAIHNYKDLANAPDIKKKVDADTSPANTALAALEARVSRFVNAPHTATIGFQFADLPGVPHFATGFHGVIDRPTLFLAGEAGRERVDVTPGGGGGTGSGRISGQLAITDWHRGVAVLDAELDNIDRTSGR